jgi:tRNA-splicing ligase RtcB
MEKINDRFLNWASILEENTRAQVQTLSQMPFIFPHIALMPDAHLGRGCAVGAVIPTNGTIIPAAVGVDIGCGMIAVRTQWCLDDIDSRHLSSLRESIENSIPLSAGNYNTSLTHSASRRCDKLSDMADRFGFDPSLYSENWKLQLGTLGSGNHFIEITVDEENRVWAFLHSGSRGVGNRIAQRHIKVAVEQCKKRWINLSDPDLSYLVQGDDEFWEYIRELRWAQHFAALNRDEMMDRVLDCLAYYVGPVHEIERINCHHNFTQEEKHFGKVVWVSRKGAIEAKKDQLGLVPGSMGAASYVVRGLGNVLSLNSSPHGAGRVHSRSAAKKKFTHQDLIDSMSGIEFRNTSAFIDEIPAAYKPIDQVMDDASDLVEIVHTLRQIVNVKGD